MDKFQKWAFFILLIVLGDEGRAGTADPGHITATVSFPGGQFIFYQNGTRASAPACAYQGRWAIDVSTLGGQAAEANVLTAFAMGRPVYVYGTGACSVDPNSETVAYVGVNT